MESSSEGEKSGLFISRKTTDLVASLAEQADDVCGRAVPQPDPNHLRRRSAENAEPLKVFILAHDYEPMVAGVLQIARSEPLAKPWSPTWVQPGY
jgi:hypothetical protein